MFIKAGVKEMGWEGVGCMYVTWNRNRYPVLVNTLMNLMVPKMSDILTRGANIRI
jgi:hypothetical protein